MSLTVGSLFSGIGGLDLGLERAGMEVKWQVEIDPWCRRVLAKHWPNVKRYEDVRKAGDELERVDLICGGFPCQDISDAGPRTGISGARSGLWRQMVRCLRLVRPRFGLVENVAALLRRGMGRVLGDLAEIGNDAEWDCLPAGAFGAHFEGDRVYVISESAPAIGVRWERGGETSLETHQWRQHEFERLVRVEVQHGIPVGSHGRVSDGLPYRVHRLGGLGNAVVPQVAEWIGRRIIRSA